MKPRHPNARKPWSTGEIARLQHVEAGELSIQELSMAIGRSEEAIRARLRGLSRPKVSGPAVAKDRAKKRRKSGASFFLS